MWVEGPGAALATRSRGLQWQRPAGRVPAVGVVGGQRAGKVSPSDGGLCLPSKKELGWARQASAGDLQDRARAKPGIQLPSKGRSTSMALGAVP